MIISNNKIAIYATIGIAAGISAILIGALYTGGILPPAALSTHQLGISLLITGLSLTGIGSSLAHKYRKEEERERAARRAEWVRNNTELPRMPRATRRPSRPLLADTKSGG